MEPQVPQPQALPLVPWHNAIRCRRCRSDVLIRLKKTRKHDHHVFRCVQCDLIFSPGGRPPAPSQPRNQNQEWQ